VYEYVGNFPFEFKINKDDFNWRKNVVTDYTGDDIHSNASFEAGYGENTNIYKCYQEDFPDYIKKYIKQFPIEVVASNFHVQEPGYIIPPHKDNFIAVDKLEHGIKTTKTPYRIFVFMNDWEFGQILMVDNLVLHNWKKGDTYVWDSDALHMSCNGSLQDKLSLIITGFLTKDNL